MRRPHEFDGSHWDTAKIRRVREYGWFRQNEGRLLEEARKRREAAKASSRLALAESLGLGVAGSGGLDIGNAPAGGSLSGSDLPHLPGPIDPAPHEHARRPLRFLRWFARGRTR
jgi:hypothetical protein